MQHTGRCHCGNLKIEFSSDIAASQIEIRECQCGFCRKHASRAVSDPAGSLTIRVTDITGLSRYRFGFATCEFLADAEFTSRH